MNKQPIYTRNLEPLVNGSKLSNILIYNAKEEELDLHTIKENKVYISLPSFTNKAIVNELLKLDTILADYPDVQYYLISNEPVFTQKRLTQSRKFKTFNILSDFKNRDFARHTGTYIYELSSLVKAVFVVNERDEIKHVQYYDDLYSNIDANELVSIIKEL